MIDQKVKEQFKYWTVFCKEIGQDSSNFKRKLLRNIEKINNWLKPLNLEITITDKTHKNTKTK